MMRATLLDKSDGTTSSSKTGNDDNVEHSSSLRGRRSLSGTSTDSLDSIDVPSINMENNNINESNVGSRTELLLHPSTILDVVSDDMEEEERFVPFLCTFWLFYPFVLLFTSGNIPKLTERQWVVLAVVCVMGFGRLYDAEIFPVSIPRIQDSFNLTDTEFGVLATSVRVGDMLSVVAGPFIDTFGRRRTAALAVAGYALTSLGSALQHGVVGFGACQLLSRFFMQVQASASYTLLVEEFDADKRGWGVGVVGGMSSLGAGITLLLNAFVGEEPWGWRFLYGMCALQIPLAWLILRHVPESKMFLDLNRSSVKHDHNTGSLSNHVDDDGEVYNQIDSRAHSAESLRMRTKSSRSFSSRSSNNSINDDHEVIDISLRPSNSSDPMMLSSHRLSLTECGVNVSLCGKTSILRRLVTAYPSRLMACTAVSVLLGMAFAPASMYKVKYMEEAHGLSPPQVSALIIASGAVTMVAASYGGRLSDRFGRRRFLAVSTVVVPLGIIGFFNTPGNLFIPFYAIQMLGDVVLRVVLNTFFGECFPTSYRATAQGVQAFFYYAGEVVSLAIETRLYSTFNNSHWPAVSLLVSLSFVCCPVILCFLPETSNRELDEVSPETLSSGRTGNTRETEQGVALELSLMGVVIT